MISMKYSVARSAAIAALTAAATCAVKSRDADNFDGCLLKPITKDSLRAMLCQAVSAGQPPPGE